MKISRKVFGQLAEIILEGGAIQAIKFFSEKLTVKATRRCFRGKINKRDNRVEILFTIGAPNYKEREFIKKGKKVGEPFPIKKILIKWPKDK